ncbi:hypothetical protein JVU11DRAFT_10536 [Chiua virens]|nr:hypothetical protein JVU11DRAFT_10536 [Chiua virens]
MSPNMGDYDMGDGNNNDSLDNDQPLPPRLGHFVKLYPDSVVSTLGQGETIFKAIKRSQMEQAMGPHGPFVDGDEWELVKWLFKHVSQMGIKEFTKLPLVYK